MKSFIEHKVSKNLIKSGWINADLSRNEMKIFRKKFKKILNSTDYI